MASDHKADVDRIAPKLAKAIQGVLADQKSRLTKRAAVDTKTEIAKTKAALLPHMVTAVHTGAKRVASVVGNGTPGPTTNIAGAWAYKGASQIATTTQGQLDTLTESTTDAVGGVFDARSAAALAIAATLVSNAINSGAQNYAATLPTATQPTKTWNVNDDHPCTECSSVDGETVPGATDFSNGAPYGPIHDGCMCSVTWTGTSTSRSDPGVTMTEERAKYSADDMKDLLAKGKAMKNATGDPSYPVADQEDIEKAVKAVGRGGADHDAIRAHIIKGAKALKLTDLIPDNWNADGSLSTEKARWFAPSTREARADESMSFGNIQSLLYAAIAAALPFGKGDIWISDCGPDWVVFHNYDAGGDFKVAYEIDGDNVVTFTSPIEEVAASTTWQPVGQANARPPAGETRGTDDTVTCPTCTGKGTIMEGNRECPTCKGDKKVSQAVADKETKSARAGRRPRRQRRSLERQPEWRRFSTQFERRVAQDGNEVVLTGTPIRYSSQYDVWDPFGGFRETMHPGVANDAMSAREFDCRFLFNHDGLPLARSTAGTLVLTDTPRGLKSEARMDARQSLANDLAIAVERGDVTQMSCGFIVATDEWRWADDGIEERDIYSLDDLFDVSAVTYPASPTTSIELAQRMLARVGSESRERIRRLFEIGGAVRSGGALSQKDGEELRAAAEALYRADVAGAPVEARMGAYIHAVDAMFGALRAGKVLSSDNQSALQGALDALHAADDIDIPGITAQLETIDKALDAGQAGLSSVLGKVNPDGDPADKNPTLVDAKDPSGDADARALQRQRLRLMRTRELLAV